jgi:hypothetical protein
MDAEPVVLTVGVDGHRGRPLRRIEQLLGQPVELAEGIGPHQHGPHLSFRRGHFVESAWLNYLSSIIC